MRDPSGLRSVGAVSPGAGRLGKRCAAIHSSRAPRSSLPKIPHLRYVRDSLYASKGVEWYRLQRLVGPSRQGAGEETGCRGQTGLSHLRRTRSAHHCRISERRQRRQIRARDWLAGERSHQYLKSLVRARISKAHLRAAVRIALIGMVTTSSNWRSPWVSRPFSFRPSSMIS
jgi:hypothetical protein